MKLLNNFFKIQNEIFDYFGYREDWVAIPLDDGTSYFWQLDQSEDGSGSVKFAENLETLNSDGAFYRHDIYTQRFLPKWVYRGEAYTMICVDTRVDGNKFLQIFDNSKEIK